MQARRTARIARRVDALAAASPRFLDSNKTSVLAEATSLLHATIARASRPTPHHHGAAASLPPFERANAQADATKVSTSISDMN
ncbi:hypothetical protein ABTA89_19740, partial [Acinetobacter baumannii]